MTLVPLALKQTAIQQYGLPGNTEHVTRSGDFARGADELDLHDSLGDGDLVRVRVRPVRVALAADFIAETHVACVKHVRAVLQRRSGSFGVCLALKNDGEALLVL